MQQKDNKSNGLNTVLQESRKEKAVVNDTDREHVQQQQNSNNTTINRLEVQDRGVPHKHLVYRPNK